MEYLAAIGGGVSLILGVTVWVLWLRHKGLKAEVKQANVSRLAAEAALKVNETKFVKYRQRSEAIQADLVEELESFQKERLDGIEKEKDRSTRIRMRKSWVAGVLSRVNSAVAEDDA